MSILNKQINRSRGSRRSAFLTGALVLALILPISTSGLWNVQAQEKSEKAKQEQMEKKAQHEAQEKLKKEEMMKKKAQLEAQEKLQEEDIIKKKAMLKAEKEGKKVKMSAAEKMKLSMEKICSNENSAACKVGTIMKQKGVDAGIQAFHKMKKPGAGDYLFKEKEFNTLGYSFLYNKKIDEAIAIFKLNVDEYPDSWNVYDSLAEAYLVAGKYEKSEKYYKKALAMNPEAESAEKGLQKIQMKLSEKH